MMWKSFFRVQNFFSAFLNVPIEFDRESETFQVTPCNTPWRKIKRFLLTNLCLFVIWGISIYRLLHQLLTSHRDENFTVLDVVIISIALAFCTEGLAHIWTFHFSAGDICYILTQSLRLTKLHCYLPQQMQAWTVARKFSVLSTTGSIVNGGFSNFSNKFPLLRLQQPDFSLKSLLQWENQVLSLRHTFLSSRFNLSKEEFIMYSIALGFNGVPLVCFLAPLMTSSDPASYLMKKLIFTKSPIIAMLAAAFFQGLTAFYASLLSLNLILICLTIVCEISAVMRTSYPATETKVKSTLNKKTTPTTVNNKEGGGGGGGSGESGKSEKGSSSKASAALSSLRRKVGSVKNSGERSSQSSNSVGGTSVRIYPKIQIDNYEDKSDVLGEPGSEKMKKDPREVASHLANHKEQLQQQVDSSSLESLRHEENSESQNFQRKPNSTISTLPEQTSLFQVLSPKLDDQLQVPSSTNTFSLFHPTFGFTPTTRAISSVKNSITTTSTSPSPLAIAPASSGGGGMTSTSSPSNPTVPSSPMLMMKIIEELGPATDDADAVVNKSTSSSSSLVKKLMCPTPIQRIKSSAEVLFVKSFLLYLQTKLLVLFINDSMFYYFPVVISVGMVLSTLSAYATIKLHAFLPLPLRLSIFLIGLTIATVMLVLMMEAAEITRHSEEFLRYWKNRLKRKFSRRQLRTCQSLRFKIGPFIEFRKDTIFGVFSTIQHYTVNLAVIHVGAKVGE